MTNTRTYLFTLTRNFPQNFIGSECVGTYSNVDELLKDLETFEKKVEDVVAESEYNALTKKNPLLINNEVYCLVDDDRLSEEQLDVLQKSFNIAVNRGFKKGFKKFSRDVLVASFIAGVEIAIVSAVVKKVFKK